ncbi:tetratricopeptide repeat protein [Longibacter salinarum]|nr:hypothetical protein [Longibacter salinarum]
MTLPTAQSNPIGRKSNPQSTIDNLHSIPSAFLAAIIALGLCLTGCSGAESSMVQPTSPDSSLVEAATLRDSLRLCRTGDLADARPWLQQWVNRHPDDATGHAWFARALFRDGKPREAASQANRAVKTSGCNSFAYTTRGDVTNPQFVLESERSADAVWRDYQQAVTCNPDAGIAWISMWPLATQRGDADAAHRAIQRIHELDFFPGPVQTLARWMFATVPPDALLLTNGDADTYPLLGLQQVDGRRTDIAVVNASLLNLPAYVEYVSGQYDLPLPMASDSLRAFRPYAEEDGDVITLSKAVVKAWYDMQATGKLTRPVVGAPTLTASTFDGLHDLQTTSIGAYTHTDPDTPPLRDASRITQSFLSLDASDFEGPVASHLDMSCIRQSSTGLRTVILYYAVSYADVMIEQDRPLPARQILNWVDRLRPDLDLEPDVVRYLHTLRERLES